MKPNEDTIKKMHVNILFEDGESSSVDGDIVEMNVYSFVFYKFTNVVLKGVHLILERMKDDEIAIIGHSLLINVSPSIVRRGGVDRIADFEEQSIFSF